MPIWPAGATPRSWVSSKSVVAAHPLRERLLWQLMLALYRSGRQAEALAAYRAARTLLSEELGLEPSEELRQLEQAILRHDPGLDPVGATPPAAPRRSIARSCSYLGAIDSLDRLMRLARPLAASDRPHELIIASVVERGKLGGATAAARRPERGVARGRPRGPDRRLRFLERPLATSFGSPPSRTWTCCSWRPPTRLSSGEAGAVLEEAPCDVALLVRAGDSLGPGPVVLPFGAAWHDWAALELGAWVARATGAPLRLMGAAAERAVRTAAAPVACSPTPR